MHNVAVSMAGVLSPRGSWTADGCSLVGALGVVSTRSAMLILREAFYGTTRFEDFAVRVGVSEPIAAARLKELVDDGLLVRQPYRESGARTRHEYRLTDKGADLFPVVVGLMQWGDRWLADDGGPVELRHRGCGQLVETEVRCAGGHQPPIADLELHQRQPRSIRESRQENDHA